MAREVVRTDSAPKALGPYSQGIKAEGRYIFVSGQTGVNPATGQLAEGLEAQVHQTLENVKHILEAAGSSLSDVVRSMVLLKDISDFQALNQIYSTYFPVKPPARVTFGGLDLPLGALVEIECIAVLEK